MTQRTELDQNSSINSSCPKVLRKLKELATKKSIFPLAAKLLTKNSLKLTPFLCGCSLFLMDSNDSIPFKAE